MIEHRTTLADDTPVVARGHYVRGQPGNRIDAPEEAYIADLQIFDESGAQIDVSESERERIEDDMCECAQWAEWLADDNGDER